MKAAPAVKAVRIGLGVAGIGVIGYGLLGLPTQLGPSQLLGLLTWLAAAVLLHDGVIVPLSTLAGAGLTRLGFGLRPVSAAVLRGALMTGAVVTLITEILLKAQSVARNTSVLEADYAGHLLWFWTILTLSAAAAIYACEHSARATPATSRLSSTGKRRRSNTRRPPSPVGGVDIHSSGSARPGTSPRRGATATALVRSPRASRPRIVGANNTCPAADPVQER